MQHKNKKKSLHAEAHLVFSEKQKKKRNMTSHRIPPVTFHFPEIIYIWLSWNNSFYLLCNLVFLLTGVEGPIEGFRVAGVEVCGVSVGVTGAEAVGGVVAGGAEGAAGGGVVGAGESISVNCIGMSCILVYRILIESRIMMTTDTLQQIVTMIAHIR